MAPQVTCRLPRPSERITQAARQAGGRAAAFLPWATVFPGAGRLPPVSWRPELAEAHAVPLWPVARPGSAACPSGLASVRGSVGDTTLWEALGGCLQGARRPSCTGGTRAARGRGLDAGRMCRVSSPHTPSPYTPESTQVRPSQDYSSTPRKSGLRGAAGSFSH